MPGLLILVLDMRQKYPPLGAGWEFGRDMFTLLYIKSITNKDLLHSIGNSTQYSVTT